MNLIKCDKCKKPKKEKLSFLSKSDWVGGTIRGEEWINFDLCGKCAIDLVKYIRKYLKINERKK